MTKALFLDRDGVINQEKHYLFKIADFEFISGIFETCRAFQHQGYLLIIITNQAGIARGKYTEADFQSLTHWMLQQFSAEGIHIDAVYHCPHHPDYSIACNCRKPAPGMLLQAKTAFNIDLSASILVGDKESDIRAGINAGVGRNILVRSGHAIDEANTRADQVVESIQALVP